MSRIGQNPRTIAQEQVDRKWSEYEELAGRGAHQFAADPRNR